MSNQLLQQQQWVGPAAAAYPLSDGPRFANVNTAARIERNTSAGGKCDGIANGESSAAGDSIALILSGHAEIVLGGTITAGQYAMSDSSGRAVVATTNNFVQGKIVKGGASGEIGEILLGTTPHAAA